MQRAVDTCALAQTHGYAGVIVDIGVTDYSDPEEVSTDDLDAFMAAAAAAELGCVALVFGYGPKVPTDATKPWAVLNGGAVWRTRNRPPAGPGNAVWHAFATQVWQVLWDRAVELRNALRPSMKLIPILFNEPAKGGVGGPHVGNLGDGVYDGAYGALLDGQIEAGFWTYARYMAENTDFTGAELAVISLAGESNNDGSLTAAGARERDSFVGADCEALVALLDDIWINSYGPGYSTQELIAGGTVSKALAKRSGLLGNAVIGTKPVNGIKETGLDARRCPRCKKPNQVRQAQLEALRADGSFDYVGMFCSFRTSVANEHEFMFNADSTPLGGVAVGPG